ncbi:MAG: hypothetical protein FD123_2106 [Bacteroidetes bacterium]|nr:MAG: hypothetical protein FD123_2106 [Bacteroidota bacterium]
MKKDLPRLAAALSGPEKRFIRTCARTEKKDGTALQHLLELLFSGKAYSREEIRKTVKGKTGRSQPHVLERRLYEFIIGCLRKLETKQDEVILQNGLQEAGLLYRKALYPACLRLLERLLKKAVAAENQLLVLEITNRLVDLYQVTGKGIREQQLRRVYDLENKSLRQYESIVRVKQDSGRLFFTMRSQGDSGRGEQLKMLREILADPFYRSERNIDSFRSGLGFFQLHATYCGLRGERKKALRYQLKLVGLLEAHPRQVKSRPVFYLISLNNLAITYSAFKKPGEVMDCIRKLHGAPARFGFADSPDWQLKVFTSVYPILQELYIRSGSFDRAQHVISDTEQQLRKLDRLISPVHRMIMHYNLAYLFFGSGNYRLCLRYLRLVTTKETSNLRKDIYFAARLVEALVYFEQRETDALFYAALNMQRQAAREFPANKPLRLFLSILKKSTEQDDPAVRDTLRKFRQEQKNIRTVQSTKLISGNFNTEAWIESKIRKTSFHAAVSESAQG